MLAFGIGFSGKGLIGFGLFDSSIRLRARRLLRTRETRKKGSKRHRIDYWCLISLLLSVFFCNLPYRGGESLASPYLILPFIAFSLSPKPVFEA